MSKSTLIHEFENFSVIRNVSGDYFIETDNGEELVILSLNGSYEHKRQAEWICSPDRTEEDFENGLQNFTIKIDNDIRKHQLNLIDVFEKIEGKECSDPCLVYDRQDRCFSIQPKEWVGISHQWLGETILTTDVDQVTEWLESPKAIKNMILEDVIDFMAAFYDGPIEAE